MPPRASLRSLFSILSPAACEVLKHDQASRVQQDVLSESEVAGVFGAAGLNPFESVGLFEQSVGGLMANLGSPLSFSCDYKLGLKFGLREKKLVQREARTGELLVKVGSSENCDIFLDEFGHVWGLGDAMEVPWELAASGVEFVEQACLLFQVDAMMKALSFVRLTPPMGADLARKLEMIPLVEVGTSVWRAWRQGDVVLFQAYGREDWRSQGTVVVSGSAAKAADVIRAADGLAELDEVFFGGLSSERTERCRQSAAPAIPSAEKDCSGPNNMFFAFHEGPQIKRCCCVHDDGTVEQYSMVLDSARWRVTETLTISEEGCVRRSYRMPG